MVNNSYKGCVRCPACGCVGSSQKAIDRHILRKRDNEHLKIRDIAARRLQDRKWKVEMIKRGSPLY